jgi:hypothetical protein
MKVRCEWSGTTGLLPLIIGANQLVADYPDLTAFVQPEQPPTSPIYPNDRPLAAQLAVAKNKNNVLRQD